MVSLLGETRMTVIYHPFRTYKIRRSALSLIAHDTPVQAIYSKTTKSYLFMFEIIFSPGDIEERSSDGQPANVATADGARRMAISSLYISQPFWNIKFPSRSGPVVVVWWLKYSAADPHVARSNRRCGGCIFNGGKSAVGLYAQIWAHVKEPQVVEISGAFHYGVSHNHMVVLER
ncbi:uncharacterized protein LOC142776332 isoform X1 [Rhipicephalus microplus]|uniref:uncharacterized protein LOC142776332 isoform X1 n=1 Tax=Rhipicephalus microplus TaxID=6941 RepID=UPI003F6C01C7